MQFLSRRFVLAVIVLVLVGTVCWFLLRSGGDPALRPFVKSRPPYPVVFTSRSTPASFNPAAPEGEGFTYPGLRPWSAGEGRLRLLTPSGEVHELTWNKPLPEGGTLVDVMSPSVSLDGARILFAGRKSGDDPGRFRIYSVALDGGDLRALTGGSGDPGTVALPPMRYSAASPRQLLSETDRRRTDYDDVDPIDVGHNRIVFASSRQPDLGRGHARRATNLWEFDFSKGKHRQLTGNRNNDRWPVQLYNGEILFSLWSRNLEVVTPDRTDVRPLQVGEVGYTGPVDNWLGASVDLAHTPRMGNLVKIPGPFWRGKPLFNNRLVFMTADGLPGTASFEQPDALARLRIEQAPPGLIANAPSGSPAGVPLPSGAAGMRQVGPQRTAEGRKLAAATPSACPPGDVLFSGCPVEESAGARAADFALYLVGQAWDHPALLTPTLLFDDPEFVDAEPVAVYRREIQIQPVFRDSPIVSKRLTLASGRVYEGPVGTLRAENLHVSFMNHVPGQSTDTDDRPTFASPPPGTVAEIRVWASHRDRFDDPDQPRIVGGWEPLLRLPVGANEDHVLADLPLGSPTMLAGFDRAGKIAQWQTPARDRQGRSAHLVGFAGDHYSGVVPGGYHFCTGCHTGHSGRGTFEYAEKLAR